MGLEIIGAGLNYKASKKAAKAQEEGAAQANATAKDISEQQLDLQRQIWEQQQKDQAPWLKEGQTGITKLGALMGNGDPFKDYLAKAGLAGGQFNQSNPQYQFLLKQGQNQLDFGPLCNKGGRLVSMCDWSLDAGQGMDDYAAFVTSEGQVVIYKGTDPASSATWSLVGVFDLGSPVGSNPFLKYAGDVLLICQDGVQPLSKALMSTRVNSKTALTEKIMYKMSDSITNYGSFVGWQLELFPRENMLILNIPTSSTTFIQYVMNTISGAWSSFSSWNSYCYELFGDNLYFGGVNYVALAWNGPSDNGSQINFNAQQSYNYLGSHQYKKVNMIRPIVSTDGAPSLLIGVNADYDTTNPVGIVTLTPTTASTWDNANWDFGVWGGDLSIQKNWQTAFTLGYAISAHMTGATITCYMRWAATDILFEEGGFI
jgi:hypothetical protein